MVEIFIVSQSPLTPGAREEPGELSKSLPHSSPQFPHLYFESIYLVQWF